MSTEPGFSHASGTRTPDDLPVDRRETPEALAAYAVPRSTFPIGWVALATLVAWLTLPVWALVVVLLSPSLGGMVIDRTSLSLAAVFVTMVLLVGAIPAALLGIPLGAALVRVLRRVQNPLVHLAAFLALGAIVGSVTLAVMSLWELTALVPATALAAATGWLVTRRHLLPPDSR